MYSDDDDDDRDDHVKPVVVVRKSISSTRRSIGGSIRSFPEPRDSRQSRISVDLSDNGQEGNASSSSPSSVQVNSKARMYSPSRTLPVDEELGSPAIKGTFSDDVDGDIPFSRAGSSSHSDGGWGNNSVNSYGSTRTDRSAPSNNGGFSRPISTSSSAWASKARAGNSSASRGGDAYDDLGDYRDEDNRRTNRDASSSSSWQAARKGQEPATESSRRKTEHPKETRSYPDEATEADEDAAASYGPAGYISYERVSYPRQDRDSDGAVDHEGEDEIDDNEEDRGRQRYSNTKKKEGQPRPPGLQSKEEFEKAASRPGELAKLSYQQFSEFMRDEELRGHPIGAIAKPGAGPGVIPTWGTKEPGAIHGSLGPPIDADDESPEAMNARFERAYGLDGREESIVFGLRSHPHGHASDLVQCTIFRDRTSNVQNRLYPIYEMWLEEPSRKVLLAMKMNMNRTSNYHIFDMTRGVPGSKLTKKSGNYLGKLRALNTNSTEYVLLTRNSEREEVAAIYFERVKILNTIIEGSQPRKMMVAVPHVDSRKVPIPHKIHEANGAGSLIDILKEHTHTNRVLCYENKQPVFENGNFRLNFNGRVSKPSVKNFQLVSPDAIDNIVCQFGKVGEDQYTIDYKAPINGLQAFCFALCQFNV